MNINKNENCYPSITAVLKRNWRFRGVEVHKLIDRDDMSDERRDERILAGVRVLRRREIEDYLYDPDVIEKFLVDNACDLSTIDSIHSAVEALEVEGKTGKRVSKQMFQTIKKSTGLKNLGQDEREFALVSLVPALMQTPHVVEELEQDIFG